MRFNLFCASAALAASLVLSACSSGGGSQAVPGGSQSVTAPMGHHGHLVRLGGGPSASQCPGSTGYLLNDCYYVAQGSSNSQGWEEEYSSGSQAGQIIPGNWYWKFCHTYKVKDNKGYKQSTCAWGTNPSNPNTQTVTMTALAPVSPASGPPPYYVTIKACSNNSPYGKGYCDGPYEIGVMVTSGT
jgi:hypothetical protein